MPITKAQKKSRTDYIGASDIPMIMGCHYKHNVTDLYLFKTKQVESLNSDEDNFAIRFGNHNEPFLINEITSSLGIKDYQLNVEMDASKKYNFPLITHLDALAKIGDASIPIEAKTHGHTGYVTQTWGPSLTDEVPDSVTFQVIAQMMSMPIIPEYAYVVAHIGGSLPKYYIVPFNKVLAQAVDERCTEFWDCVKKGIQPKPYPSIDIQKLRIKYDKKYPVNIEDVKALIKAKDELKAANAVVKLAEAKKDAAEAVVRAQLKDGTSSVDGFVQLKTTHYKETVRKAYVVERLVIKGVPTDESE